MPSLAASFFLAFYALVTVGHARTSTGPSSPSTCDLNPDAIVSDACTSYSSLDKLSTSLSPYLTDVTQNTDFFSYYRLNLYSKTCPFWNDESSMCGNRACAVDTIEDERDIPPIWRAEELSKLEGMRAMHPGRQEQRERPKKRPLQFQLGADVDESCVLEEDDECDERDYCVPEDEGAAAKGDYVSLVNNTERFTGYAGEGAHQVWNAIYKENCFTRPQISHKRPAGLRQAASDLQNVFQDYSRQHPGDDHYDPTLEDECIEQRAFYRIISGMHTSISAHLCWDYFNQKTGKWFHNTTCYNERLASHPERISNLYFNYALVTRAVAKLRKHLEHYTFCSGDPDQDYATKQKVLQLAGKAAAEPNTFDESVMFTTPELLDLKDSFKHRFRNVSRLMDCVGCDKCRLWGKVQTAGYGAALKVLFEFDETKNGENPHLRRTELVALINTWGRISHSLEVIGKFRNMIAEQEDTIGEDIDTKKINAWVPKPTFGYATHSDGNPGAKTTDSSPPPDQKPQPASQREANVKPKGKENVKPAKMILNDPSEAEDDGLDDDPYTHSQSTRPPQSVLDQVYEEWDLIWRAYKMVLKSWVELPFKISGIAILEMQRLWNFWLGYPVPPRSWDLDWSITVPRRDEL